MRKILHTLFLILLLTSGAGIAQPFTSLNANIEGLGFSNAAWGDYDNDGDLDLAINGEPGSTIPVTRIYRNDNGSFTDIQANIQRLTDGSLE